MKVTNTVGTSKDASLQKIIHDNIALWRRERRGRTEAITKRDNSKRFNAIADAMPAGGLK